MRIKLVRFSVCVGLATGAVACGMGAAGSGRYFYGLDRVRDQLGAELSCPQGRIVITELERPPKTCIRGVPPPEVASEPDRLAVWNKTQDARLYLCEDPADFLVDACGIIARYRCTRNGPRQQCRKRSGYSDDP